MELRTPTGTTYAIVRPEDAPARPPEEGPAEGLEVAIYAGREHGAFHLEAAVATLAPGGSVGGHIHPFEESFFVLAGRGLIAIGDSRYQLRRGDFGFVPLAYPHAWNNPFDETLRWLRVRSPQPRPIGDNPGTYPIADLAPPTAGRPIEVESAGQRFVGHFDDEQVPPPGPLAMPGYHGYNIRNVSIRMMVDELLGAQHHTLFVVEFIPSTVEGLSAKEHFHPFEEIYYFVAGAADGRVGGEPCSVKEGDLVFAGVNTSHGFTNTGDVPVRWIEAQAPKPPPSNGTIFESDWLALPGLSRRQP
jgi:mannose-6-phosphate isomerase-like protein (cupin superfamily)